jgi:phosphoglycolate phosphatase/pyrophosphatase PpaX
MLKFPCLVLDHDETVVQSEKTIGYPCFCQTLSRLRPERTITVDEYVHGCHEHGFVDMCRKVFGFSEEELLEEYRDWQEYIKTHVPSPFPGIESVIQRQKAEGGILCVVSHSGETNITRDYAHHFGILPNAIYGCDQPEDRQKPNPWPLQDIMERYHLSPSDILVVDDMKLAWKMASPLGVPIAFAGWGKTDFPELAREMEQLCDFSFYSTEELHKFLFD